MTVYYQRENITLHVGDALAVLATLPAGSVDLVFTSPPYNAAFGPAAGGFYRQSRGGRHRKLRAGYGEHDDAMPHDEYVAWQQAVLRECWRVIAPAGAIFYNHRPRIVHKQLWFPLELNPGLPLRQVLIWDRGEGVGLGEGHFCPMYEWIMVFAGDAFRLTDRSASARGDVWRVRGVHDSDHPAPFPVGLPERALLATGAATVLDPFCGTGTTLRAALNLGRRAIGVELSERYCRLCVDRLAQVALPFGEAAG